MHAFDSGKLQLLGVHSIFCLTAAHDGSLWAATEGGGLLHVRGDEVDVFSQAQGLTDNFVRVVFESKAGVIWVGTDDGLFRLKGKRLQRVDGQGSVPLMAVHSVTEDRDANIWVGGSQLVRIAPVGTAKIYPLPGAYSKNRVKRVLQTSDGTIWVGTVGGLEHLVGDRFQALPPIHATVRSLLQATDGTLWIGTIGDGLWRLRGGSLTRLDIAGLLPSDTVLSLLQDDAGQIWIGTQAGLVRLSHTLVGVVPLPHSGDPDFQTISGDAQGNIWVAGQKLFVIRDGVARETTIPGLPQLSVRNVFRGHDALWVGTDGSGAYRVAGHTVQHLSAPAELTNNFIRGFLQTRDGAVWIATDEGVSRIAGSDIRKFTESNGLAYFSTRCLLEDRSGGVWIGTDRGVSLWRNGAFQSNGVSATLVHEKVWSILQDRKGALWFATRDHGLYRFRDGVITPFTTAEGLPSNSLYEILQDGRGTFWLTGPDTIASIGEAQLDAATSVPADQFLSVQVYTMPFGADGAQMYGGRQPAGFLAPNNTFWFPTSSGAAYVRASNSFIAERPPVAQITQISEDGRILPARPNLRIPAGTTRLSVDFSSVLLRPHAGIRFRYRLEPLEKNWSTTDRPDTATYTNLSAGRYRFRVQSFDAATPEAIREADLAFVKAPYFYQTLWFYTLVLVIAASVIWAIYRFRVRQMRMRFRAVLEERSRLAREMHDTVIQGCTGISALLEAMASSRATAGADEHDLLTFARQQARTTIDEARQAVWDMRHDEKEVDLLSAMRSLAEQTMREHGGAVTLRTSAESLLLGTSAAHEILMTVREAVYNAVQHSRSERIEMVAEQRRDELTVRIADFGQGFEDPTAIASPERHFGLTGMRERMNRLGGRLELRSAPGEGTTVTLRLRHLGRMRVGRHIHPEGV